MCEKKGRAMMIALIMEIASAPETSINFYQTTRRNNPEDSHVLSSPLCNNNS
jgi:hypothetical protein